MQTILNVTVNPSVRDPWDSYNQEALNIMLENGAKIIHVTPILEVNKYSATYTSKLSYVIEEPETEEYKQIKREKATELYNRIEERVRRMNR